MTFIKTLPAYERVPMRLARLAFQKGHSSVRKMFSKQSEENFTSFARLYPNLGRGFLNVVFRLGPKVKTIVFPAAMAEFQNHAIIKRIIRDHRYARSLVNEKGVLDLRKAEIKMKAPYIDLTPNHRSLTLEDYIRVLEESYEIFERNEELGDLFLYKFILRARVDLYVGGEKRSALKQKGEKVGLTPELRRIIKFLGYLTAKKQKDENTENKDAKCNFPFGKTAERVYLKGQIESTCGLLKKATNNPAANAVLAPLTRTLRKKLESRVMARLESAREAAESSRLKLRYERGEWRVRQEGYKKSEIGLVNKEDIDHMVSNAELLSRIKDQIEGISQEMVRNRMFIEELWDLRENLPNRLDVLFELYLAFTKYFVPDKEIACAEIEGAWQLAAIGTDQAVELAKSLLGLAIKDIKLRQASLDIQGEKLDGFYGHAEKRVSKIMIDFAEQICDDLARPDIIHGENGLQGIDKRLRGFLGTFFKGDMREEWLGKAKAKVYGLLKGLPKIMDLVQQRQQKISAVRDGTAKNVLEEVKAILKLNEEIIGKLEAGARFILLMELVFINRNGQKLCEEAFYHGYGVIFGRIRTLNLERITVVDRKGRALKDEKGNTLLVSEREARDMGIIETWGKTELAVIDLA